MNTKTNDDNEFVPGHAGMLDDPSGDNPEQTEPDNATSYDDGDYIVHAPHGHISYQALLGSSYEPFTMPDVASWDDSQLEAQQDAARLEICGALESLLTLDYDEFLAASAIWQNRLSTEGSNLSLVSKKLKRSRQSIYRLLPKIIKKAPILQFLVGDYEAARKVDS